MKNAVPARFDPVPMELIGGKVVMMSPRPRPAHNRVLTRIASIFERYLEGKPCVPYSDGVDVYLDENNHFIPDVMIVCNHDIIHEDGIYGAPDLVVEVLSPSTTNYDRGAKLETYGRAGVREYWLVSPLARTVEVYLNHGGVLTFDCVYEDVPDWELDRMDDDDRKNVHVDLKVSLYDDLIIPVRDIFYKM